MRPPSPPRQRITRSSRSRPSLHGRPPNFAYERAESRPTSRATSQVTCQPESQHLGGPSRRWAAGGAIASVRCSRGSPVRGVWYSRLRAALVCARSAPRLFLCVLGVEREFSNALDAGGLKSRRDAGRGRTPPTTHPRNRTRGSRQPTHLKVRRQH
jgi:hypothetical protein